MPTENRSTDQEKVSQLEMAHVVRASLQVPGMPVLTSNQCYLLAQVLNKNLAPAQQGESEPVGWQFYQQGRWWNGDDRIKDHRKNTEEAGIPTRDVFVELTGEYHADCSNLLAEVAELRAQAGQHKLAMDAACGELESLGAQLAEAQALLREFVDCPWVVDEATIPKAGIEAAPQQVVGTMHVGLLRLRKVRAWLSASAEPSAPLPPVNGDLLPPIGSKVLIHLAREDKWVEHTVVGYYAWENHRPDPSVHRVFVRVRDAEGYLNARLLSDVRPIDKAPLSCNPTSL